MIAVTGSAGHLGEAVVRSLRAANRPVVGIDLKPSAYTDHVGSLCSRPFVASCLDGVSAVVHAATLHKPHVVTHGWQDFIDTNVSGTVNVLECAAAAGVRSVIYVSTTSTFGSAMSPAGAAAAVWVTEQLVPQPKNIYGVTKLMAESLCELTHRQRGLPVLILRTSRFFPEDDDNRHIRQTYTTANAQANELLYRRVDIEDAVAAVLLAVEQAPRIGFGRYIISATTPLRQADLPRLLRNAPEVIQELFPEVQSLYGARGWKLLPGIDRVYVNDLARTELGWQPRYDFAHVLECLRTDRDFRSPLALEVGAKGYHDRVFTDGPYPV